MFKTFAENMVPILVGFIHRKSVQNESKILISLSNFYLIYFLFMI